MGIYIRTGHHHRATGLGIHQEDAFWYVAKVQPGATDIAIKSLNQRSIPHLHPQGTFRDGTRYPLLPGYLFVLSAPNMDAWSEIKEARGIERFLPVGAEVPGIVPSKHMDAFYARFVNGEFNEPEPEVWVMPRFARGESVAISSGPFAGQVGKFKRVQKGAVVLDVTFFGQTLEAVFKGHQVSKLN